MKIEMNEKTFLDMVHTIIQDVEYSNTTDFGCSDKQIAPAKVLDDLGRGLGKSRLVPAWDIRIDNALKMLITEMMNQAVDVAEAVLATQDYPFTAIMDFDNIHAIQEITACSREIAEAVFAYHKEYSQ